MTNEDWARFEISLHHISCFFGIHDYSEDSTLSWFASGIKKRKITVLKCFYCGKRKDMKG
jgi:hypothetical protein